MEIGEYNNRVGIITGPNLFFEIKKAPVRQPVNVRGG